MKVDFGGFGDPREWIFRGGASPQMARVWGQEVCLSAGAGAGPVAYPQMVGPMAGPQFVGGKMLLLCLHPFFDFSRYLLPL